MRVTWWGHATVTLETAGARLLTDPVLGHSVGHLRRRRGPAPTAEALRADAVLISHLHADHLHVPSLRRLPPDVPLVVPHGTVRLLRALRQPELAARCHEVRPGDRVTVAGAQLHVVPAQHDGRRSPLSRHRGPAVGYLVRRDDGSAWFAGDTDLFPGMADLAPVDLALVPVGGWGPTLGAGHLDPARAAEAVRRVRAAVAVPIHFGTLWPRGLDRVRPDRFLGPETEFARRVAGVAPDTVVRVLAPGESVTAPGEGRPLTPRG